jgi:hypothetical protein
VKEELRKIAVVNLVEVVHDFMNLSNIEIHNTPDKA